MNKHEYICKLTEVVRQKSSCMKRKVGAIFINSDYEVLATGFNESPRRFPHCDNGKTCGSPCTRTIHAEQNAICQAAKRGVALKDSILYCTYLPCISCARLLVNIRIQKVIYEYSNADGGMRILRLAELPALLW